ncbi:MAG: hypothetical protein GF347_05660 [Candidatus Moranbacteria bacterium]|nr:hypothetical protein [Candidatus Moranbacteria bacterium]
MSLTNIKPDEFYRKYWLDSDLREWEIEDDAFVDRLNDPLIDLSSGYNFDLPIWHIKARYRYMDEDQKEFYNKNNSLEINQKLIEEIEDKLKRFKGIKALSGWIMEFKEKLTLIKSFLPNYLFTNQLFNLKFDFLEDLKNDLKILKERKELFESVEDLNFSDFSINNETIFAIIEKNAQWRDVQRDLEIYKLKREQGLELKEIGAIYGIKFNSVSMVVSKVQGEMNRLKGEIFEKFVYERLQMSGLFEEVIWGRDVGDPDILAYQGDKLFIYSLKNLQIDRNPYWLIINPKSETSESELRPELEFAKLSHFDYETHLILLVFDNFCDRIIQSEIDYSEPQNLDLTKL